MRINIQPGVYSGAIGLAGAGAVTLWPNDLWIGYSLFGAAALLFLWGVRLGGRHLWQTEWLHQNLWWRFKPTRAVTVQPRMTAQPPPDWIVAKDKGFDYPAPKALLRLSVKQEKGTRSANTPGKPFAMSIVLDLETIHTKPMEECSVCLARLERDGQLISFGETVKIGAKPTITVHPRSASRFHFLRRDMTDEITPDPFLIVLESGRLVLSESATYVGELELRSQYPIPTVVYFQLDTGIGLDACFRIMDQKLKDVISER